MDTLPRVSTPMDPALLEHALAAKGFMPADEGAFLYETGVKHLSKYIDSSGKAARELAAFGLPTTLLIDREGREVGRLIGPAEWDSPQMVSFIRSRLGMGKDSSLDIPQIRQEAMVIPVDNIESPVALNHQPLEEMTR